MSGENFQMFNFAWFAVIVLSPVIALTAGDFLVLNGKTDVTNEVVVGSRKDCYSSFDDSSLPIKLRRDSVAKPRSLNVSLYDTQSSVYQGATFEWIPPAAGVDLEYLEGYYVEIKGESEDHCRLYIFNNAGFTNMTLTFILKIENFSRTTDDFTVKVYSMPAKKSNRSTHTIEQFELLYMKTKIANDSSTTHLAEWSPTIAYKPLFDEKSVDVHFSLPPRQKDWLAMQFNVLLLSCQDGKIIKESLENTKRTTTDTEIVLTFNDLEQDKFYSIVVKVKSYNTSSDFCSCGENSTNCCCGFTQTKEFTLSEHPGQRQISNTCKYSQMTEKCSSIPEPSSTAQLSSTENPEIKKNDSKTVAIVVSISIFLVLLIAIAIIYCYKKRQGFTKKDHPIEKNPHLLPQGESAVIPQDLQRKTVYIVAAPDHREADNLLKNFCAFLKAHCLCDVINPSNVNLHQTSRYESIWVTSKMSSSDYIIFVNSREMGKLLNSYLTDSENLDLLQSVVCQALRFSFNPTCLKSKFMTVTFNQDHQDWFENKLAILNPKSYCLPKQLPHLLRGLHNLSLSEAEKYEGQLPLNMNYLDNLQEWMSFLHAIREVESYEKKSKLLSETKVDSITSSKPMNGAMSVSMTDLTITNTNVPTNSMKKSSSPESLKNDPDNVCEVDKKFSKPPFRTLDASSFVTVDKASDIQKSESKEPSHLTELNQTFSDRHQGPKVSKRSLPPLRIPRQGDMKLSTDDNFSNVFSKWNDNLSVWSKQPDCGTTDQKESREESKKSSQFCSPIIPPQGNINPTSDDNMSSVISQFNDNLSVWSKQPAYGTIDDKEDEEGFERSSHFSPAIIPPQDNINPLCDDNVSNVMSQLNDNLSVWSRQPAYGTIDNKEDGGDSEKSSYPVAHHVV